MDNVWIDTFSYSTFLIAFYVDQFLLITDGSLANVFMFYGIKGCERETRYLLERNVFILGFQIDIWNDVAMKLLFSRIREEIALYIFRLSNFIFICAGFIFLLASFIFILASSFLYWQVLYFYWQVLCKMSFNEF